MEFSHFIITQFNLRNFPLSNNKEYERWLIWTRNRISLFEEYCLPSVLNQSNMRFTWLLYFDSDTPGEFNEFIKKLTSHRFINICYCKGAGDFNTNYFREVMERTGEETEWIITTRIDNDDCLHKDAVRCIQENFTPMHKFLISLASGYILNTTDRTLSHYFYPMSPFISLIESRGAGASGVFERIHTRWDTLRLFVIREIWLDWFNKKARKSRFILKKPMWVQTVHGENVSNSFYRGFPVLKKRDLSDYSIRFPTNPLPVKIIGRYCSYVTWKRYLKSLIVKIVLNK